MELETAIHERRSIRKFKPSDIDRKVLQEIMEIARWSPPGAILSRGSFMS